MKRERKREELEVICYWGRGRRSGFFRSPDTECLNLETFSSVSNLRFRILFDLAWRLEIAATVEAAFSS
jgi:hypothetical protein